jgi:capsular polysaccharide transport system permease protein
LTRNTVAEPARTNSLVPDAVDRARTVSKFLDRVAGVVVEAQAGGRSLSDRAREGRTLVGTVLRRRRISPLAWSAILAILLPTLVGAVYYGLIASNQYASDVRFSIRGNDTSAADLFSGLSGMLGTSKSLQDSYLVTNYLTSREVVEDIEKKVPLRAMYTKSFIDYL